MIENVLMHISTKPKDQKASYLGNSHIKSLVYSHPGVKHKVLFEMSTATKFIHPSVNKHYWRTRANHVLWVQRSLGLFFFFSFEDITL